MNFLKTEFKESFYQFIIALDQFCNCFIGILYNLFPVKEPEIFYADETMSSHCWRWYISGKYIIPRKVVDTIFFFDKNHCEESYMSEKKRNQAPPECR